jgi:hypothetical protein
MSSLFIVSNNVLNQTESPQLVCVSNAGEPSKKIKKIKVKRMDENVMKRTVVEAINLKKTYMLGKVPVEALRDVNLKVEKRRICINT